MLARSSRQLEAFDCSCNFATPRFLHMCDSSFYTHVYTHTYLFSNYKTKAFEKMLNVISHQKMQPKIRHTHQNACMSDTKCWGDSYPLAGQLPGELANPLGNYLAPMLNVTTCSPWHHSSIPGTYLRTQRPAAHHRERQGPQLGPSPCRGRTQSPSGSHLLWHHGCGWFLPPCSLSNHTGQACNCQ